MPSQPAALSSTYSQINIKTDVHGTPTGASNGSYFHQHERRKKLVASRKKKVHYMSSGRRGQRNLKADSDAQSTGAGNSDSDGNRNVGNATKSASSLSGQKSRQYDHHHQNRVVGGKGGLVQETASTSHTDSSKGADRETFANSRHSMKKRVFPSPTHGRSRSSSQNDQHSPTITRNTSSKKTSRTSLPQEHPDRSRRTPSPKLAKETSSASPAPSTTERPSQALVSSSTSNAKNNSNDEHKPSSMRLNLQYPTTRSLMKHMQHRRPAGHRRSSSGVVAGSSGSPLVKTRHRVTSSATNAKHFVSTGTKNAPVVAFAKNSTKKTSSFSSSPTSDPNVKDNQINNERERPQKMVSRAPRESQKMKSEPTSTPKRFNRWSRKKKSRPTPLDTSTGDKDFLQPGSSERMKSPLRSPGVFGGVGPTGMGTGTLCRHPLSPAKSAAHLMEFVNAKEGSPFAAAAAKAVEDVTAFENGQTLASTIDLPHKTASSPATVAKNYKAKSNIDPKKNHVMSMISASGASRSKQQGHRGSAPDLLSISNERSSRSGQKWTDKVTEVDSETKSKASVQGAVLFEFPLWNRKKKKKDKLNQKNETLTDVSSPDLREDIKLQSQKVQSFVQAPKDRPSTTPEKTRRLKLEPDNSKIGGEHVDSKSNNDKLKEKLKIKSQVPVEQSDEITIKEDEAIEPEPVQTKKPSPPTKVKGKSSSRGGLFGLFRRKEKASAPSKGQNPVDKSDETQGIVSESDLPEDSGKMSKQNTDASKLNALQHALDVGHGVGTKLPASSSDNGAVIFNFPLWDRKKKLNTNSNTFQVQTMLLPLGQADASQENELESLDDSLDNSMQKPKVPNRLPESEMNALIHRHVSPSSKQNKDSKDKKEGNKIIHPALRVAVSPKVLGADDSDHRSSSAETSPVGENARSLATLEQSAENAIDKQKAAGARQPTPPKNKRAQGRRRGPRTNTINRQNSPQDTNTKAIRKRPTLKHQPSLEKNLALSTATENSIETVSTDMDPSFSFSRAEAAAAALGKHTLLDDNDDIRISENDYPDDDENEDDENDDDDDDGMEITPEDLENSNHQRLKKISLDSDKAADSKNGLPVRKRSPTPKHQSLVRGGDDWPKHGYRPSAAERMSPSPLIWKKGEQIGRGTYGHVHMALNQTTGELFCVKSIRVAMGGLEDITLRISALEKEISVMKRLQHPHIVRYLGTERAQEDYGRDHSMNSQSNLPTQVFIFLEYVPGGSLSRMLKQFGGFSTEIIRRYTKQILRGLAYLHNAGIIHRDVKGANVLVTETGVAKLADFGCSKQLQGAATGSMDESLRSIRGSVPWMAPEVIKQSGAGRSADIWSLGCTVIEMATAKRPWPDLADNFSALFHVATAKSGPPYPEGADADLVGFLDLCFCLEPGDRASAEELLRHPLVAGVQDVVQLDQQETAVVSKSADF